MDRASFAFGGRQRSRAEVLVIAEIGTGHGADLGKARALIEAAARSGADCAKFQHVLADEIVHPRTGLVPLPGGNIAIHERFRQLETSLDFLAACKEDCEAAGLLFLCTPFGLRSARDLRALGVEAMKLASPELNHAPLLGELASYRLPTLVSSGVSTLADIERALGFFEPGQAALLHCVTAYPAPPEDYNLALLENLSALFGVAVGVSDHSAEAELVPALAVARGACAVEKHICLSREDPGLDDPIALPPQDFARMVGAIRAAQGADAADTEAELGRRFGPELVKATIGDGQKRLAPSEAANYGRTNRSLHAARRVEAGETLDASNVAVLRTEKVLRPGLDPFLLPQVLGRRAARAIPDGEGIEWEDLGGFA